LDQGGGGGGKPQQHAVALTLIWHYSIIDVVTTCPLRGNVI